MVDAGGFPVKQWRTEWVVFDAAGVVLATSHGATAVAKVATGRYTVTWSQAFASVNYIVQVTTDGNRRGSIDDTTLTTGSVEVQTRNDTTSLTDPNAYVAVVAMGAAP